jgi:hypothetical protein
MNRSSFYPQFRIVEFVDRPGSGKVTGYCVGWATNEDVTLFIKNSTFTTAEVGQAQALEIVRSMVGAFNDALVSSTI